MLINNEIIKITDPIKTILLFSSPMNFDIYIKFTVIGITDKLTILTISVASVNFGKNIGSSIGPKIIPINANPTDKIIVNFFKY